LSSQQDIAYLSLQKETLKLVHNFVRKALVRDAFIAERGTAEPPRPCCPRYFNGAAMRSSRKEQPRLCPRTKPSDFNGAAMPSSRKDHPSYTIQLSKICPLFRERSTNLGAVVGISLPYCSSNLKYFQPLTFSRAAPGISLPPRRSHHRVTNTGYSVSKGGSGSDPPAGAGTRTPRAGHDRHNCAWS
jgi:hypothetical protein